MAFNKYTNSKRLFFSYKLKWKLLFCLRTFSKLWSIAFIFRLRHLEKYQFPYIHQLQIKYCTYSSFTRMVLPLNNPQKSSNPLVSLKIQEKVYAYKVVKLATQRFPFKKLQHRCVGEGAAPFTGFLHLPFIQTT